MIFTFDFDGLSVYLCRQMKRKRALLESNLSGINLTVTEMSSREGFPRVSLAGALLLFPEPSMPEKNSTSPCYGALIRALFAGRGYWLFIFLFTAYVFMFRDD